MQDHGGAETAPMLQDSPQQCSSSLTIAPLRFKRIAMYATSPRPPSLRGTGILAEPI